MSLLFFLACGQIQPITTCESFGGVETLCGWQNPEDMAALPDGRHVIVSEYGDMLGEKPGQIALLDLETEGRSVLYAGEAGEALWGDPDCVGAPGAAFSPHGIDLSVREDGERRFSLVGRQRNQKGLQIGRLFVTGLSTYALRIPLEDSQATVPRPHVVLQKSVPFEQPEALGS